MITICVPNDILIWGIQKAPFLPAKSARKNTRVEWVHGNMKKHVHLYFRYLLHLLTQQL